MSADPHHVLVPVGAFFALVDAADAALVGAYRWHAWHYTRRSGRFEAACGGKRLGCYDTAEQAALAYDAAARATYGPFAATNADLGLLA